MTTIAKVVIAALCVSCLSATSAGAVSLFFAKRQVKTQSEAQCLSFARDVARRNLSNVRFSPGNEVAGSHGGAYASITCVGVAGGRPAIAVVMVAGDNPAEASALRETLARGVASIQNID